MTIVKHIYRRYKLKSFKGDLFRVYYGIKYFLEWHWWGEVLQVLKKLAVTSPQCLGKTKVPMDIHLHENSSAIYYFSKPHYRIGK